MRLVAQFKVFEHHEQIRSAKCTHVKCAIGKEISSLLRVWYSISFS
jgi:hypothetical protein